MSKKTKVTIGDVLDEMSTSKSRAGASVQRIYEMSQSGLSDKIAALLMEENSANNFKYTPREVKTIVKLYEDCKTKVLVTKAQANVIIKDCKTYGVHKSEVEDKK